jgi:flavorubredoxin
MPNLAIIAKKRITVHQETKRHINRHQRWYTDKKENKIFIMYKEIQKGAVAKSYMTNGLL